MALIAQSGCGAQSFCNVFSLHTGVLIYLTHFILYRVTLSSSNSSSNACQMASTEAEVTEGVAEGVLMHTKAEALEVAVWEEALTACNLLHLLTQPRTATILQLSVSMRCLVTQPDPSACRAMDPVVVKAFTLGEAIIGAGLTGVGAAEDLVPLKKRMLRSPVQRRTQQVPQIFAFQLHCSKVLLCSYNAGGCQCTAIAM